MNEELWWQAAPMLAHVVRGSVNPLSCVVYYGVHTTAGGLGDVERGRLPAIDLPSFVGEDPGAEIIRGVGVKGGRAEPKVLEDESAPFVLNSVLPVVPARLVKRILKGDFIDMVELLWDNLETERETKGAG